MDYTITPIPAAQSYTDYANEVLGHVLRAVELGEAIGVDNDNKPEIASSLSDLFPNPVYVIHGPKEYGGAIKGDALLGYVEYYASAHLRELQASGIEVQNAARRVFLQAHNFKGEITDAVLRQVDLAHVALWSSFKDRAIIAPTSGSFGVAAYQTIERLRHTRIIIAGQEFPLLQTDKGEGKARGWLPDQKLHVMTPQKTKVITDLADELKLPVQFWTQRNTRDHYALLDALAHDDYFCPTNPKNGAELAKILRETLNNSYKPANEAHPLSVFTAEPYLTQLNELKRKIADKEPKTLETLAAMGIHVSSDLELKVHKSLSAGRFGLGVPRLRHIEEMLANSNIAADITYNQPAIGATFAAAVDVDAIMRAVARDDAPLSNANRQLLEKHFPHVAKVLSEKGTIPEMTLALAPDVCNTTLAKAIGLKVPDTAHNNNPENGLGTITPGQEAIDVITANKERKLTSIQQECTPATKPWIAVAQVLLYLHEMQKGKDVAQFPESAAAAGLASVLKQRYDKKELTIDEIVFSLRKHGVNKAIFEKILNLRFPEQTQPWEVLEHEAQTHGQADVNFLKDLQADLVKDPLELRSHLSKRAQKTGESITIYNTGSNGTRYIHQAIYDEIVTEQENFRKRDPDAPEKIVVIGGGLIGMQSAKELNDKGYDVTVLDAGKIGGCTSSGNPGMWSFFSARGIPLEDIHKSINQDGFEGNHIIVKGTGINDKWESWVPTDSRDRDAILQSRVKLARLSIEHQKQGTQSDPALKAGEFRFDKTGSARFYYGEESAENNAHDLNKLIKPIGYEAKKENSGLLGIEGVTHKVTFPGGALNTKAYCKAQAEHLQNLGAQVREGVMVAKLLEENNHCCGIETENGEKIYADAVVLATGANTALLKKVNPDISDAIVPFTGVSVNCKLTLQQAKRLESLPRAFQILCPESIKGKETLINLGILTRDDGGQELRVGGMMLAGKLKNGEIFQPAADIMKAWAYKLVPDLQEGQMSIWHGERSMTPDLMPIVGEDPKIKGVYYNIGQNSSGTSLGAGCAVILAQEIDKTIGKSQKPNLPTQGRKNAFEVRSEHISPNRFGHNIQIAKTSLG